MRKRRDVEREIAEYAQLQARLRALKAEKAERAGSGGAGVKTLVNVGSDMFMQATAPLDVVHVAIGYGLMPELSLEEAAAFIPKRVALLKRCVSAGTAAVSLSHPPLPAGPAAPNSSPSASQRQVYTRRSQERPWPSWERTRRRSPPRDAEQSRSFVQRVPGRHTQHRVALCLARPAAARRLERPVLRRPPELHATQASGGGAK